MIVLTIFFVVLRVTVREQIARAYDIDVKDVLRINKKRISGSGNFLFDFRYPY